MKSILPIFLFFFLVSCSINKESLVKTYACRQIVVVTTKDWSSTTGKLFFYNWNENAKNWKLELTDTDVVIGRKGFAWGKGLQNDKFNVGELKKEGDKKNPAGFFFLKSAFGYKNATPLTTKLDYLICDSTNLCIDDINSRNYNKVIDIDTVKSKDWKSYENMFSRKWIDYKYGIVVAYNTEPAVKSCGSCIFFHLLASDKSPTSGCTSTQESTVIKIIESLDKNQHPIIIQMPEKEYNKMRKDYVLPEVK